MLNKSLPNFLGPRSFVQTMVPGLLRIVHVTVSRILLVSSHVQQCPIISAIATVTSVAATTAVDGRGQVSTSPHSGRVKGGVSGPPPCQHMLVIGPFLCQVV